jgi:hypothetical protein
MALMGLSCRMHGSLSVCCVAREMGYARLRSHGFIAVQINASKLKG